MRHGSLFSGIGGFDLAAQWAGFENIFQVEIDNYCQKVLEKNFPNVKRYKDIKEFDGTEYTGTIDIISGGFPCQPFSVAGKQKGAEDDRNLWPEMFRVIQEIRPTWVLGENVANILNFVEFDNILADLEAAEYEVWPLIIPAVAVDAKHRRDRVWIVAYADVTREWRKSREGETKENAYDANTDGKGLERPEPKRYSRTDGLPPELCENVADTEGNRWDSQTQQKMDEKTDRRKKRCGFDNCNKNISTGVWPVEPNVGRVANGIPRRVDRLKGLGNAIVPQVAYRIFETIKQTGMFAEDNEIELAGANVFSAAT